PLGGGAEAAPERGCGALPVVDAARGGGVHRVRVPVDRERQSVDPTVLETEVAVGRTRRYHLAGKDGVAGAVGHAGGRRWLLRSAVVEEASHGPRAVVSAAGVRGEPRSPEAVVTDLGSTCRRVGVRLPGQAPVAQAAAGVVVAETPRIVGDGD